MITSVCYHSLSGNFEIESRKVVNEDGHWDGEVHFFLKFNSPNLHDDNFTPVIVAFSDTEGRQLVDKILEHFEENYGKLD